MSERLDWPDNIYPVRQVFFIRPSSAIATSSLTGHIQSASRHGGRWVATLDFRLGPEKAALFEAFLAKLQGPVGTLLVPDFRRTKARTVTQSMDDYAERTGLTFFEDRYDFSDQTHEEGFLTTEEPIPVGLEENLPLSAPFETAFLLFPDDVTLLLETGEDLLAENVGIPLMGENDETLITVDFGAPLEIALEEGFTLDTEYRREKISAQVGGGFIEGAGQPELIAAAYNKISIDGLPPFAEGILFMGEAINTSKGRAHLILDEPACDINGYAVFSIAPNIREEAVRQALIPGHVKVLMRIVENDAGRNETVRPAISTYQLQLEETLP
jgi:hypothetical protein